MSVLAQPPPPLSVRTHHKFRKIRDFLPKSADVRIWRPPSPLFEKCPHWTTPSPWLRSFYGRPLTVRKILLYCELQLSYLSMGFLLVEDLQIFPDKLSHKYLLTVVPIRYVLQLSTLSCSNGPFFSISELVHIRFLMHLLLFS